MFNMRINNMREKYKRGSLNRQNFWGFSTVIFTVILMHFLNLSIITIFNSILSFLTLVGWLLSLMMLIYETDISK